MRGGCGAIDCSSRPCLNIFKRDITGNFKGGVGTVFSCVYGNNNQIFFKGSLDNLGHFCGDKTGCFNKTSQPQPKLNDHKHRAITT